VWSGAPSQVAGLVGQQAGRDAQGGRQVHGVQDARRVLGEALPMCPRRPGGIAVQSRRSPDAPVNAPCRPCSAGATFPAGTDPAGDEVRPLSRPMPGAGNEGAWTRQDAWFREAGGTGKRRRQT
jgi:hypothetical protein